jgi:hypothetical protein
MIFLFILLGALFVFSFCTRMFYMLCLSWILTFMKTDIPVLKRGLMYTGGKLKNELLDKGVRLFSCQCSPFIFFYILVRKQSNFLTTNLLKSYPFLLCKTRLKKELIDLKNQLYLWSVVMMKSLSFTSK